MLPKKGGSPPPPFPGKNAPPADPTEPDEDDAPGAGGKASRAAAHIVSADEHCGDCANFEGDSCSKVQGSFSPEDACIKFFQAGSPSGNGDGSGMPDDDSDDSGSAGPMNAA